MSAGPLTFEIIFTFFLAAAILYRYGNWYRHHIIVTVAVLIAWYFSMIIVFVLPLDVSNTIYETCIHETQQEALRRASSQPPLLTVASHRMKRLASTIPPDATQENATQENATDEVAFSLPDSVDTIPDDKKLVEAATKVITSTLKNSTKIEKTTLKPIIEKDTVKPPTKVKTPTELTPTEKVKSAAKSAAKSNKDNKKSGKNKYSIVKKNETEDSNNKTVEEHGNETITTEHFVFDCKEPFSRVEPWVFPALWRVVYWTSQVLTWLLLPLMQSYTKAGDFTVWGKLRSALIDNAIYYGSYLLIVGVLLLYIALRPDVHLNGSQLRAIAASASNTWGLFWLVLLLGYGLVEVPRWLWNSSCLQFMLNQSYFRSAKLAHERAEAWDHLNDLLQSVHSVSNIIGNNHPLRPHLDTIESKIPAELLDRMRRNTQGDSAHSDVPSEKALIRIHKQLLKALQHHNRVETQWGLMVNKVIYLEDAQRNSCSHDMHFKHSTPKERHSVINVFYPPTIEWLWVCRVKGYLLRVVAFISSIVSAAVVWSELTFFVETPTLSIFAIIVNIAKSNHDYVMIEIISSVTMAYIALCAYSTLTSIRVLNLYYLAPHHQTDQYSLIFSGMMLCRLTPPMCLNFLSLIHMDSHIIGEQSLETHYTQVMGHMDVISIISDGFNIYFPMMIVALCLATYFSLGSRLLSALGFQQFISTDSFTSDLIDEGRTLISREQRKRVRQQEYVERRKEFTQRFGMDESPNNLYRSARQRAEELLARPYRYAREGGRLASNEVSGAQMELLPSATYGTRGDSASIYSGAEDYNTNEDYNFRDDNSKQYSDFDGTANENVDERGFSVRNNKVDRSLFDDV